MRSLVRLTCLTVACFVVSAEAQDATLTVTAADPAELSVSALLNEFLLLLPKEPEDLMACMTNVKKYRNTIASARQDLELKVETPRIEYCLKVKAFDRKTEILKSDGDITENDYQARKEKYAVLFDLHCNDGRARKNPPEGFIDMFPILSSRLGLIETATAGLVEECTKDGRCFKDECNSKAEG